MKVKTGKVTRRRHNKILKATKGFRMSKSSLYKVAHESFMHAGQYAYEHRQKRQAQIRKEWIRRITAAAHTNGTKYNLVIKNMAKNNIEIDRKVLADIALNHPKTFTTIVKSF